MILTVGSKLLGFVRELVLAYTFGASNITDAYLISLTIPTVLMSFVGAAVHTGFIPLYIRSRQENGEDGSLQFTRALIRRMMLFSFLILIAGWLFTRPLVLLFASGFSGETLELAVRFTRITLLGVFFSGALAVLSGFLQVNGHYLIPGMVGIPLNLILIATFLSARKQGLTWLAAGSVLALATQALMLFPLSRKLGLEKVFRREKSGPYLRQLGILILPVLLGTGVDQINVLVDRTLASGIVEGGISALNYAARLSGFTEGIVLASILTVVFPVLSAQVADQEVSSLKETIRDTTVLLALLVLPASAGLMLFSGPIVEMLFSRGAFGRQAVVLTAGALQFYSAGLIFSGIRGLITKVFYSMEDTRSPLAGAVIAVSANIMLNLILSRFMGLRGLALATSLSAALGMLVLLYGIRRKIGPLGFKKSLSSLVKILAATLVMALILPGVFRYLLEQFSVSAALLFAIATGVLVYGFLILLFRVKEARRISARLLENLKEWKNRYYGGRM